MIKFSDPNEFISNSGSPIHDIYEAKVDKKGVVNLVKVGEENTDDKIQAAKASTDIETIIAYYNNTGDVSVLNRYAPMYGDFTELPKTFAEFLQLRIDSKKFFEALPVDIKKKFNNNADEFFATAGNEEWFDNIKSVVPVEDKEDIKEGVEE